MYNHVSAEFDPPSAITPATVNGKRTEYRLYVMARPLQNPSLSGLRMGLGYSLLNYTVDASTPSIITEQHSQGLSLMAEHDVNFNEKWFSTLKLLFYLPHSFREKNVSTGFNPKYTGTEIVAQINWELKKNLRLYFATIFRTDTVRFDGTGTRGVTGGTDSRTTLILPVGMHFDF